MEQSDLRLLRRAHDLRQIDVARAICRVPDFLANFFKRQPDPDKASLDDYIEASKPDDGDGGDQKYRAKIRDMPSPTKNPGWNQNPATSIVVLPPNTSGGVPVLFQANAPGGPIPTTVADIQGNGTLLSTEGMKRGTFDKGKLNGVGEEIDPDGTWRSGTYQYGRSTDQVWEVRTLAGKTYVTSGAVVDGKLDGMIMRVFADGSTQFEDWEGGKLMQVGSRAPKGQGALAPQARYKPVEEVELEDAYKHIGPRTKIAPGTTFDPTRTVRAVGERGFVPPDLKLPKALVIQLETACGRQFAEMTKQASSEMNLDERNAGYLIWHLRQNHYAEYLRLPEYVALRDYLTTNNGNTFYEYAIRQARDYPSGSNNDRACVATELRGTYGSKP